MALLGSELCDALAYVHGRKDGHGAHLVHGDVTPHNVLLSPEGHALLGDFGLARFAPRDQAGTRRYQSPEQARGEPFDGRADLYALALVLCEAATGLPAYDRDRERAAAQARVGIVPPLDGCDAELAAVLRRALSAAPDGRPAGAGVLRDQLDALLDGDPRARTQGREELVTRVAAAGERSTSASRLGLTEATREAAPASRRWSGRWPRAWSPWPGGRCGRARPGRLAAARPGPAAASPGPAAASPGPAAASPRAGCGEPGPAAASPGPAAASAGAGCGEAGTAVSDGFHAASGPSAASQAAAPLTGGGGDRAPGPERVPWAHVLIDGRDWGDTPLLDVSCRREATGWS